MIPRRIIQTWKTRELPPRFGAAADRLRRLHPGFEYLLFDDPAVEQLVEAHYPEHLGLFRSFAFPIQRIDLFRMLAVHHLGGFYFDLDVELEEPIDELVVHRAVFPFECLNSDAILRRSGYDGIIGQYGFGACAGEPFLEKVVANMHRAARSPAWAAVPNALDPGAREQRIVLYTTGPVLVTRTYVDEPDLAEHITVLFSSRPTEPAGWHRFGRFGRHWMAGTWHGDPASSPGELTRFVVDYLARHRPSSLCVVGGDVPPALRSAAVRVDSVLDTMPPAARDPDAEIYLVNSGMQQWPARQRWLSRLFRDRPDAHVLLPLSGPEPGGAGSELAWFDPVELFRSSAGRVLRLRPPSQHPLIRALTVYDPAAPLVRLGRQNDGGYVICDGLAYDGFVSGGVADDLSFEDDFLRRHPALTGDAFDGSIARPPIEVERLRFHPRWIAGRCSERETDLRDLLRGRHRVFVKMDVEGAEYAWLAALSDDELGRISQLVIEFHLPFTAERWTVLERLARSHHLVRLHGNNYGATRRIGDVVVPEVLECTYVRKDGASLRPSRSPIPGPLDQPNCAVRPEIALAGPPYSADEGGGRSLAASSLADLGHFEWRQYSQNGEDGILDELLARCGETNRVCVEISVANGTECNTRLLRERGWTGLAVGTAAWARDVWVTADNVEALLHEADTPTELDVLSLDIDGNDLWVLAALWNSFRPRIVVVEYNAWVGPDEPLAIRYDPQHRWDGTDYFGASLQALTQLASARGYALVGCDTNGVNAFFVRDDVWARAMYRCGVPRHPSSWRALEPYPPQGQDRLRAAGVGRGRTRRTLERHWGPHRDVLAAVVRAAAGKRVLEIGPGATPFPAATEFVDWIARTELGDRPVHVVDVNRDRLPFDDRAFDFVYCRHVVEDLYDPIWLCREITRVGRAGYVEAPSPMAEYSRGVDGDPATWRGYMHHRYLVWSSGGELHFLPKYPIIEHLDLDIEPEVAELLAADPLHWNTYHFWDDTLATRLHRHDHEFQVQASYGEIIVAAIEASILENASIRDRHLAR